MNPANAPHALEPAEGQPAAVVPTYADVVAGRHLRPVEVGQALHVLTYNGATTWRIPANLRYLTDEEQWRVPRRWR